MRSLTVYVKDREAGVLSKFRDGTYEFHYAPNYRLDESTDSVAFSTDAAKATV